MFHLDVMRQSDLWSDNLDIEAALSMAARMTQYKKASELSVVLCDDAYIQELNAEYRGKDKPTNVLSFPQDEDFHLGDIVIAFETIKREADEQNKTFQDHFSHMLVHGFLHLLGYDHESDEEADVMENTEIQILGALGIKNPYEFSKNHEIVKS